MTVAQEATSTNVATVLALFDSFNRGDLDHVRTLLDPEPILVDLALGQTFAGQEGFLGWLRTFSVALPDAQTRVTRVIEQGDWVATEHLGGGTHTGPLATPLGEIPPTGRAIALEIAEHYRLRDGKIAEMRAYWDIATLLRQIGVAS